MLPTIIYGSAYVDTIEASEDIDVTTKFVVSNVPLLLAVSELFFALLLAWKAIK